MRIHFLDVGEEEYGDCVLCELGGVSVLIDGAHPGDHVASPGHASIPQQLGRLLAAVDGGVRVDLLVVTHAHQDHIGCLPFLVGQGLLTADWALVADPDLGWGRIDGDGPSAPDVRVSNVVAAIREEVRSDATDNRTLRRFLADAAGLEQRYRTMLDTLENATPPTRVVRHGRDDPDELLSRFEQIGLEILGPSQEQLRVCAEAIAARTDAAFSAVADAFTVDGAIPEMDLYRALVHSADADTRDRPGPAINLQSIVTTFRIGDHKLLFAGDMQFADPQLADDTLRGELRELRDRIRDLAPYAVAKLSHHGSDNGLDAEVLNELGATRLFGICAGEDSLHHPNARVLRLLDSRRDRLRWVRTDRNGLATVRLDGRARVTLTHGRANDARPNTPEAEPAITATAVPAPGADVVEVVTRVPSGVERVALTIDVPRGGSARAAATGASDRPRALALGGGRHLPPLLFVTSVEALAANVGEREGPQIVDSIRGAGQTVLDLPPSDPAAADGLVLVREQLQRGPAFAGVVVVGGYDAVPPRRIDCLPPPLRQRLGRTADADDFIVWSDEAYGDRDGDGIAELPVTRVPDGRSADTVVAALSADGRVRIDPRRGVRNIARPFAEPIFSAIPGTEQLLISQPTTFEQTPDLAADLVYLMLHGDYVDSSRFWGENTLNNTEAVSIRNIPTPAARVVFTGCCWGALVGDQPAFRALNGTVPAPKVAEASIALTFLARGATAFVGCTGAHYSPSEAPFDYFGGPMHVAFWRLLVGGTAPAQALFDAKVEYVRGFPHGRTTPLQQAVEYKILRQYTCLGLGW